MGLCKMSLAFKELFSTSRIVGKRVKHFMIPTRSPQCCGGRDTPTRDFPGTTPVTTFLRSVPSFSVPSKLLCDDLAPPYPVKVWWLVNPAIPSSQNVHTLTPQKKTWKNILETQVVRRHMINIKQKNNTSHRHWQGNPTGNHGYPPVSPPLLRPS